MALNRLTQITSSGISSTSTITVSAVAGSITGVVTATSLTVTGDVTSGMNVSGIVTATTVQVGSATTIHTTGIDLGSGNITSHNINSTGIITSTSFVGPVTGNVTGDLTGDVTGNVSSSGANTLGSLSVTNDATVGGALTVTGDLTVNGTTTTIDTAVTAVDSLAIDGNAIIDGSVGIGTDNPSWGLDLQRNANTQARFIRNDAGDSYLRVNSHTGNTVGLQLGDNTDVDKQMIRADNTNNALIFNTANSESLRITSDGKVGIGLTNPKGGLHVYSDATGEAPAQPHALVISRASSASNRLLLGVDENSGYGVITSVDPGAAWTNTTINPTSGNVGIGLTNPSAKLHISSGSATQMLISNKSASMSDGDTIGTIDFTAGPSFTTNARVAGLVEGTSEAGGDLIFETRQDGGSLTEKVRITSIGNVGIGTQIPGGNLHIESSAYPTIKLQNTSDASGFPVYQIVDQRTNGRSFNIEHGRYPGTFTIRDNTASSDRISVDSSGNIGIGLTNPSARLHVHGGTNDTPAYFDTGNANGAHIRFLQSGSVRHFLGCGGGISLGDKDDLTMRAYDNIIFATANSSTRKATLLNGGEFIVGATSSAAGLVHVQHDEITAAAPSLGWPHYLAETDDNARIALHLETAGNSSTSTAGQGASVVLRMGQYYDSRAVITTLAAGGSSPSDQGTGHGKDLLVKGGRSDNGNGKYGGRLFLNGGSGYNSNAYDTNYGHCIIQGLGGLTGIGELSPNYPLDISHTNNSAYSSSAFIAPSVEIHNQSTSDGTAAGIHMYVTGSGANAAAAHINCVHTGNGSGALCFGTRHNAGNHSERLRITSNGDFWVSGNSMNHLKNEYRGSVSVTGANTESFAFEFAGSSLASGGLLYFWGTSGNVVVNVSAEILINHSGDVTIRSMSGAYTQGRIRLKTDSNTRCKVLLGRSNGYVSGTTTLNWRFIPYGGTYAYTTESTFTGTDHTHNTSSGSFYLSAAGGGSANVNAAGSKNFLINHPLESLRETTRLAHAAIEGPECNTIYRGKVDLVGGTATVNIDTNSRMTEGTFEALNQNVQCFTTNETGWTAIKGSVSGNLLTITAQDNTCTDTISWMVVGERKDQDIINNRATDSEGRFIPEITDEYDASQFAVYTDPVEETEYPS